MRLIDRDEILNRIGAIVSKFPEEYDEKTYKMIRCEIRNKNREVNAIPIEWIEKQMAERENYGDFNTAAAIGYLLLSWEEANEHKESD